jgi:hypothetical protein
VQQALTVQCDWGKWNIIIEVNWTASIVYSGILLKWRALLLIVQLRIWSMIILRWR